MSTCRIYLKSELQKVAIHYHETSINLEMNWIKDPIEYQMKCFLYRLSK